MKGKMTVSAVLSIGFGDIVKMVSVPPGAVVPPPTEPPPGGGGGGGSPPYPDQGLPAPQPRPEHPIVYPPEATHPMVPPPPGTSIPPTGGTPLPPGGGIDAPHPEHPIYYPPGTRPEAGQDLPGYQPPAGWPEGCPYPTPYGLDRALARGLEGSAVVGELTIITNEGMLRVGQVYDVDFTLLPGSTVEPGAKGGGGKGQGQGQSGAGKAKPKSNFP